MARLRPTAIPALSSKWDNSNGYLLHLPQELVGQLTNGTWQIRDEKQGATLHNLLGDIFSWNSDGFNSVGLGHGSLPTFFQQVSSYPRRFIYFAENGLALCHTWNWWNNQVILFLKLFQQLCNWTSCCLLWSNFAWKHHPYRSYPLLPMALVAAEPDSLEEREVPGFDSLVGLAEKWEASTHVRQRSRRIGGLLEWPSPEAVGVPSMSPECKRGGT